MRIGEHCCDDAPPEALQQVAAVAPDVLSEQLLQQCGLWWPCWRRPPAMLRPLLLPAATAKLLLLMLLLPASARKAPAVLLLAPSGHLAPACIRQLALLLLLWRRWLNCRRPISRRLRCSTAAHSCALLAAGAILVLQRRQPIDRRRHAI